MISKCKNLIKPLWLFEIAYLFYTYFNFKFHQINSAIETEEFLPEKTVEPIEQEVSIESTRVSKQEGQDWMLKKLGLIKERFLQAINWNFGFLIQAISALGLKLSYK